MWDWELEQRTESNAAGIELREETRTTESIHIRLAKNIGMLCAKSYTDWFKMLSVIEEKPADIFEAHGILDSSLMVQPHVHHTKRCVRPGSYQQWLN